MPNAAYTSWTVTLRPNLVFHDGTPCNGAALLTNFQAQAKSLLTGIVLSPTLVSITQTGPLAVTITFKAPWVPFPYYLAGGIGGQIAYVAAPSMLANPNGTTHPVGTGPFVFKEWIPNDHFTATANPNYWRKGMPYLSQITFKPIPDEEARAEALKSGTIDLMITDTPQIITQFRGNKSYSYIDDSTHVAGEPDMNCVQLNCLAKPFNDANVRRAAAMAINRKQYAKVIDEGVLPVSNGLFVPGSPYYSTTPYPAYNPTEAAKLVKAAAKTNGGPISFSYGSTNSPAAIRAAEYLEQAWQAVGFQVKTNIVQQNDTINNALAGKYQALGWRQFGAVDPDLNYIFWSTTTVSSGSLSINMARNADPHDRDGAPGRLGPAPTTSVREAAYKTVNKRLALDLPYLWTDRAVWAVIGDPTVQNFNNPTTPQGQAGLRHDRGLHLADPDLDQLSWRLMSGRILVVEDDERIRSSMRLALEGEGYEVRDAASGEEGLDLFAEAPTDVALIDLMLPGMDGFECCRALRRSSAVPIIIVTARADTHDVVAGLEAGADDYVTKPFVAKELAARIRALLRRARPAEEEPGALDLRRPPAAARAGGAAPPQRRRGALHPDRVPPAVRAGGQPQQGAQPRAAARPGLGLRLLRRRAPGRRPHPALAHQGRGGPRGAPAHTHREGHGLQAGALT